MDPKCTERKKCFSRQHPKGTAARGRTEARGGYRSIEFWSAVKPMRASCSLHCRTRAPTASEEKRVNRKSEAPLTSMELPYPSLRLHLPALTINIASSFRRFCSHELLRSSKSIPSVVHFFLSLMFVSCEPSPYYLALLK